MASGDFPPSSHVSALNSFPRNPSSSSHDDDDDDDDDESEDTEKVCRLFSKLLSASLFFHPSQSQVMQSTLIIISYYSEGDMLRFLHNMRLKL
jgi:hypothetical protein